MRRQSDSRIVPMKVGNATGGKARVGCFLAALLYKVISSRKHYPYTEVG